MKKYNLFVLFGFLIAFFTFPALSNNTFAAEENADGNPFITLSDGTSYPITGVDEYAGGDSLIIYTTKSGEVTAPFADDIAQAIIVNQVVVEIISDGVTGTSIPSNGYVLSGSGSNQSLIESLQVGDAVILSNLEIPVLPERYFEYQGDIYPIQLLSSTVRGAGQIVVFDRNFGATTNTNPWGLEFAVVDGQVTAVRYMGNANQLAIPENGVVVSIHIDNEHYPFLSSKIKVGETVSVVTETEIFYNAARIPFDAMNPKVREDNPGGWDDANNQPFPGFRGANQVIVYDSSYGSATGTNGFGYEFVVENGVIVKTGGNNNAIPDNGLVVSGHGTAIPPLTSAGLLAANVSIDLENQELVVIYTPQSMVNRASMLFEQETADLEEAKRTYKDVNYGKIEDYLNNGERYLDEARAALDAKDYRAVRVATEKSESESTNAHYTNFESRVVEQRGVWMRPTETTREEVRNTVNQLKEAGINAIYLETSNDVYTIYPSSSPYVDLNPRFNGQDMLQIYIEEAHAVGIEIHAWYKVFMVEPSVLQARPEWALETRDGAKREPGTGFYWLSHGNEEAREYIKMMVDEIVTNYDIDGFQYDYIRYPDADMGYEAATVEPFIAQYGVDPRNLTPKDPEWLDWAKYRENLVNTIVYELTDSIRSTKLGVEISTSVWPQYDKGPTEKMQNPKDWVDKGYIDILFPMSYHIDVGEVIKDMRETNDLLGDKAYHVFGVGSYMGLSQRDFIEQMYAVQLETEGIAVFESSSYLSQGYAARAAQGLFSREAISPENDPRESVITILLDVERKIDEIYLPLGGMEHQSINPLKAQLNTIVEHANRERLDLVDKRLNQFLSKVQNDRKIDPEVVSRITTDIEYAQRIISLNKN